MTDCASPSNSQEAKIKLIRVILNEVKDLQFLRLPVNLEDNGRLVPVKLPVLLP
jgi:hypothetical protein